MSHRAADARCSPGAGNAASLGVTSVQHMNPEFGLMWQSFRSSLKKGTRNAQSTRSDGDQFGRTQAKIGIRTPGDRLLALGAVKGLCDGR